MKWIDKGPPLCCQCPQSCNKSQEVAGSLGDAGLWRRPLCWKVKPPGLLAAAAGSWLHPVLSSPALHPTPRIHLLVRVPTSSSPTHSPVYACCSVPGPPSCRSRLWAWLLVSDALGAERLWGMRPGASRSVLGSGLPQGLRRGHQHSGAALEPRWGPLDLTSLLALQAM